MKMLLAEILKKGILCDNQFYRVIDSCLENQKKETIQFKYPARRMKPSHFYEKVWDFMNDVQHDVNIALKKDKQPILFNHQEYEHNTDDPFITVNGKNWTEFSLSTGNVIGFIKKGSFILKISSRFGDTFLKYIIADADGFLEIDDTGGIDNENDYQWLLYYLWKIKLKKAFRLGIPKSYISETNVSTKVRGNIDAVYYFTKGYEGKYKCTYSEHSYLNPTTLLITEVFRSSKSKIFTRDIIEIERAFVQASKGQKIKAKDFRYIQNFRNPYYFDYNHVIDLSKLILANQSISFGETNNDSAFLFDVSMLFEYFIRKSLLRNGFSLTSKFANNLTIPTGTYSRKLQPDMVIESHSGVFVFDVKYKSFDSIYGVKREDLFQLHTYLGQYGNQISLKGGGFIYPQHGGFNEFSEEEITVMGKSLKFLICKLAIPQGNDETFFKEFNQNCISFFKQLKQKLN